MAGLWADSPDYYSYAQAGRVWTGIGNAGPGGPDSLLIQAGAGRRAGTAAWRNQVGGGRATSLLKTLAPTGDAIVCFAVKIRGVPSAGQKSWFGIGDSTAWHVVVNLNVDLTLSFFRPSNPSIALGGVIDDLRVLLGSTTVPLAVGNYYHVSIRAKIHDSLGTLSCRINRNEALGGGAGLTGLDTRNASLAAWSRFGWASSDVDSPSFDLCDVVACDSSGAANNDHPGDCAVLVQLPNAGNGGNIDWSTSAGTDHGTLVRENPADDDATYVQGTGSGQRDTYIYPALGVTIGTPRFVIARPCLKLTAAGSTNVLDVVRKAGVNYDGAVPQSPTSGGYTYLDFVREVDPATGLAWTIAGINASESGVKVQ